MYFLFLTSKVQCGESVLDIANRQNAHSQTIALRGSLALFQLVGRQHELNQEVNSFSISHSDACVKIWGYYAVIHGQDFSFYRHPIAKFDISRTEDIYDLWVPGHLLRICYVIDMPTADDLVNQTA